MCLEIRECDDLWLMDAKFFDPEGAMCGACGKPNTFCDDVGWFYGHHAGKYVAHCHYCFTSKGYQTAER